MLVRRIHASPALPWNRKPDTVTVWHNNLEARAAAKLAELRKTGYFLLVQWLLDGNGRRGPRVPSALYPSWPGK